jgi:DNA-binding transcriptional ArsR family regulator
MQATHLIFTSEDWAQCRFVRSLLWETNQAVRALLSPQRQRYHRAWLSTVDVSAATAALPALLALNPVAGWVPDFLAPMPRAARSTFERELSAVQRYPLRRVAEDLRRSLESEPTPSRAGVVGPLIKQPALARRQLTSELRYAWDNLLAPWWDQVDTLISSDIAYRSQQIADHGSGATIDDLHPNIRRTGDHLSVRGGEATTVPLGGRGLALMPCAFAWPNVIVVHEPPWEPTLVYPARGIADLWTAPHPPPPGLSAVLGNTRALLLDDLDQARTTTGLSRRHGLSPAATSEQLTRLKAANLIIGQRRGKEVLYRRSALGSQLVRATRTPGP